MFPTITIDPSALWLIDHSDTLEGAENALVRALEWMKPNSAGPLSVYLSSRSVEAMANANVFPAEPRLTAVLQSVGLEGVVSAKTLAMNLGRFLANSNWIENEIGLKDVIFNSIQISPDPTGSIVRPDLKAMSAQSFGLAALCSKENARHSLYGFPRQMDSHQETLLNISTDISDFGEEQLRNSETISRNIKVLGLPCDWPSILSGHEIWQRADGPEELELAIWLHASELEKKIGCGLKPFRVGTQFFECLAKNGAAGEGPFSFLVLQKCSQTVLNHSSLEPKPFYTSTAENASVRQRKRDLARAWRLHVTKSHQALRLMYWEQPSGQIEFATLEEKVSERIDDGEVLPERNW